ncbi:hypothetical protein G6R29_04950 [Fructobacillus sp. M2-14]|uniref:Uncharacterized protein n=1 Tax=Fructobacillus broussonetiae TaxID=2713173 RepID=A0ABS5R2S6_9LACO|nr:hypothetical protein [Fructobacillus broussonetiae]MBS9338971.1 hypothetical protein [Fructobacillus broussonetiae]
MKNTKKIKESSFRSYELEFPLFNFTFLTSMKRYDLNRQENDSVSKILLKKLMMLSQLPIDKLIALRRESGLEVISENQVKRDVIPNVFSESGRYEECFNGLFVLRLGKSGRLLLKRRHEVFYVIAVDTHFDLYSH